MLLVHWHLGLAEKERHWQVNHLLAHHLFREAEELPTIVAGDCNDWRNTLADGPFGQHGFAHVTAPISRYRSFPAYLPMGSLDKAFTRGDVFVRGCPCGAHAVGQASQRSFAAGGRFSSHARTLRRGQRRGAVSAMRGRARISHGEAGG